MRESTIVSNTKLFYYIWLLKGYGMPGGNVTRMPVKQGKPNRVLEIKTH